MKKLLFVLVLAFVPLCFPAEVQLAWLDNASNEQGFTVERAPGLAATTGFVAIANVGVNITAYVDASVLVSTAYSYRVRAYNESGASDPSNTASVTTLGPPPAVPGGLDAVNPPDYVPPTPTVTLNAGESLLVIARNGPATGNPPD